jgi:hypothetical protein
MSNEPFSQCAGFIAGKAAATAAAIANSISNKGGMKKSGL